MSENTSERMDTWNVQRSPKELGDYIAELAYQLGGLDDLGV